MLRISHSGGKATEAYPLGYEGPEQYQRLMAGFYEKTGFSISGDGDLAMKILDQYE